MELAVESLLAVVVPVAPRNDQDPEFFDLTLHDLRLGDVETPLEGMVHAAYLATIGRHDVVLDASVDVEEDIARPAARAGLLRARADVADPVADHGSGRSAETRDDQRSADPLVGLLLSLDLDDPELHVDVEPVDFASRHRDDVLGRRIVVADGGGEGCLDRGALMR